MDSNAVRERWPLALFAAVAMLHLLLQMGFYNYALGVALSLHAMASWRQGERWWVTSLWILFCALSHPLPAAAAVVFITIAWLMTSRRWTRLVPLTAPAVIVAVF